jgi:serine protease inhibitor
MPTPSIKVRAIVVLVAPPPPLSPYGPQSVPEVLLADPRVCASRAQMHLDKKARTEVSGIEVSRVDPEMTKLWDLSNSFCIRWEKINGALGARNVLAAFYLLAKCAQNSLGTFPTNYDWFDFDGRFLGIYVRDEFVIKKNGNIITQKLELAQSVTDLLRDQIKGVKVTTLATTDGPEMWAGEINSDCKRGTKDKIDNIVDANALSDPRLTMVLMAAEFVKGDWLHFFTGKTITNTPFYGMLDDKGGSVGAGSCNMMNHSEVTKGYLWNGVHCKVALMPTKKKGDKDTAVYGLVVLPQGEQGQPTDPQNMILAANEVKNNLESIKNAIRTEELPGGHKFPRYDNFALQLPRIECKMESVGITAMCGEILPENLMNNINNVVNVNDGGTWKNAPMQVGAVYHATYVKVHETGFEAAAATAIGCYRSAGASTLIKPTLVRCDRAFLFYLVDLGAQPHVLYFSRIIDARDLENAPKAEDDDGEIDEKSWHDLNEKEKHFYLSPTFYA